MRSQRPGHLRQVVAQALAGDREHHEVGVAHRFEHVGGGGEVARERDAGQVVGVLVPLADRGRQLLAPGPQHDVGAGVGEHLAEGGPPRPGAEDGRAGHADFRSVGRAQRAVVEHLGRRPLAAQLLDHRGDAAHHLVGGAAQHLGGQRPAGVRRQVDRRARHQLDPGAGQQVQAPAAVGVQDPLRAPLRQRDDRGAGQQREPRDAGLGPHRPLARVAGDGALRVDDDALAGLQGGHRVAQRQRGVGRVPVHRDLLGTAHDRADQRPLREQRALGHEPRDAPGAVDDEVGQHDRVGVRDVVGSQDQAAGRRHVLGPAPHRPGERPAQRLEDAGGQAVPEAQLSQRDAPPDLLHHTLLTRRTCPDPVVPRPPLSRSPPAGGTVAGCTPPLPPAAGVSSCR